MAMRSRMARGRDRRVFSKTSSSTKAINLGLTTYRGGRRL